MRIFWHDAKIKIWSGLLFLGAVLLLLNGCLLIWENHAPVAHFSCLPREGYAPLLVQFDASGSYDPDGRIVSYTWEFDDGATATGKSVTHTYEQGGTYSATLRIEDQRGATGSATTPVTVREVPEGYLLRHYEWEWEGGQTWDVLLPENLYQMYHDRVRQPFIDNYNYDEYVLEPLDDPTLADLAQALLNRAGGDEWAFLTCALAFVQGAISYGQDPVELEYPLYPIETLVDGSGDCEDTAILYVSLLKGLDRPSSMAFVDTDGDAIPDHVTVLIPVASPVSITGCPVVGLWEIQSQSYVLAETATGTPGHYIPLGCDPWGLSEDDFKEIWHF